MYGKITNATMYGKITKKKKFTSYVLLATFDSGDTEFIDRDGLLFPPRQSPTEYDYISWPRTLADCRRALENIRQCFPLFVVSVEALPVLSNGMYRNYPIARVDYDDELRVYSYRR